MKLPGCSSLLALLLAAAPSLALGDHSLPLWQLEGGSNRVWLLGSIHLLRESDYPLPAAIADTYARADTLVMELDMDDLDPATVRRLATELGVLPADDSLQAWLGDETWQRAQTLATAAGIATDRLTRNEPWLAALTVEQIALSRLGFDPELGIESHLVNLARHDGKPIVGLETIDGQLRLLDTLPLPVQRRLLLDTLADSATLESTMNDMLDAWRHGDIATLEHQLAEDAQDNPALYEVLIAARNRHWVQHIETLLDDDRDYLVVVGLLHLAGKDGVPCLLAAQGLTAVQLGFSEGSGVPVPSNCREAS